MPCVIDKRCPVCGEEHTFYIDADLLVGGTKYALTCPEKGTDGAVAFNGDGVYSTTVRARPPGAVVARPIDPTL